MKDESEGKCLSLEDAAVNIRPERSGWAQERVVVKGWQKNS